MRINGLILLGFKDWIDNSLLLTLSANLMLNPQLICNHRDELAIRRL